MPINALNSCFKSELNWVENVSVLVKKKRKLKNPDFWVCRLKCRGIAIALPSRAATLLPGICTESILSVAGRGIECGAAALDSRNAFLGFLRLFK